MEVRSVSELFGQPPPPRSGRQRLIASGIDLFYRFGITAVGLDRVIKQAGVTKTTFYKHFESKDDLVLACVQQRDEWEMMAWDRAVKIIGGDDPRAQLLAFFKVLDSWFNDPEFRGCIFINTAAEVTDRRDPIHRAAAAHKRKARDHFRTLAAAAGAADPDVFADEFTILLEGTMVLRHVHDRDDAARIGQKLAQAMVERYLPNTPNARM